MPTSKPRVTVTFTDALHRRLTEWAQHENRSLSSVVVELLEWVLDGKPTTTVRRVKRRQSRFRDSV